MKRDRTHTLFRPKLWHWLPVVIATLPVFGIIVAGIMDGAVALGCAMLVPAVLIAGYNGLTTLFVGEQVVFRRYGRTLWRTSADHVRVRSSRMGELPIVSALIISDMSGATGAFPKNMLAAADLAALQRLIERRGGTWSP